MATLIQHAASIARNSLRRSRHVRAHGLPDDGVRMVMSEFGVAAYDIWRTGADQRAKEPLHRWGNAMANPSASSFFVRLRSRWQRMVRNRRSRAELWASC
jgi:hypothetical protein